MAPPLSFTTFVHSSILLLATSANAADVVPSNNNLLRSYIPFGRAPKGPLDLFSRAAVVLPTGWAARGCLREPSSGRALTGYSFTSGSMTVTSCVAKCDSLGYRYAAAEYGSECYCGNSFAGGDLGGGTVAPAGECNMACAGDATQICGAGWRMSAYELKPNTTVAPVLPSAWSYSGCVREATAGRTLTGYSYTDGGLTIDKCVATCNTKGFSIAGAQYSSECYCGNSFQATDKDGGAAAPATDCKMPCAGESTQTCGDSFRLSIYTKNTTTTTPTTPTTNTTDPNAYAYVGCLQEPANGRLLTGYSFTNGKLTVELCQSTCKGRGFTYYGVEYGNECYCGTGYSAPVVKANEADCSMPCAGNSAQKCGAGFRINVYSTESQTSTTTNLVLPPYWGKTSQCLTEANPGRALGDYRMTDGAMTLEKCVKSCDNAGYKYAGAQYANECWCSNTISTANGGGAVVPTTDCNMGCAGNGNQKCGGSFRLTVFTKSASASSGVSVTGPPAGWTYMMCAVDNNARILIGYQGQDGALTPASCIAKCVALNYRIAGLQNGNECYCSNGLTNNPIGARDKECANPCAGDSSRNCGGGWRMSIYQKAAAAPSGLNPWSLVAGGNSGIVMTHVAVVNNETVLVIDRNEANPLKTPKGYPAWGAVWSLLDNTARGLLVKTHSFCSAGSFLGNGTLVNFGGHPYTSRNGAVSPDGHQGIRLFNACPASGSCDVWEDANRVRMASNRWYPTTARLPDGSAFIVGGMSGSGFTNTADLNNPTYEFYPVKNTAGSNGLPIRSQFFVDTLPHNLFPHIYSLSDDRIFVAASNQAMILNWRTGVETRLPNFPNGQLVVYPMNAAAVLLPLTPENNYTPEILVCGGSHLNPKTPEGGLDAQQDYASAQCSRMVLDAAGIAGGWKVEWMPEPRVMGEGVLLPDGKVLLVNGARSGVAGYGNVANRVGDSNADNPVFTPLIYDPAAPAGQRFTRDGMPTSNIARMYHSVATLLPSGAIMIGGSNPNDDVSTIKYASEYRVEYLNPPYMTMNRPSFSGLGSNLDYNQPFTLSISVPVTATTVYAILMDYGFSTHSVHMDQKLVKLPSTRQGNSLLVTGPPNSSGTVLPGPGWIIVMADGVPSVAQQVMVGTGASPPVDDAALANMLASTNNPNPSA
ncbi:putative fungistatic metabolite [Mycena kentingensis (nom. inval.)]|nr:putative fungistatic metabolite [Mycena kentingensis (nom. inval.)]